MAFLKDYAIFTMPGITLTLILDARENARMTISRRLRMKADEEIRAAANDAWDGKPFDEPPPSSR